jgi:hypothetical protein
MKTSYIIGIETEIGAGGHMTVNVQSVSPLLAYLRNWTWILEWATEKNYPIIEKFDTETEAINWYQGLFECIEKCVYEHNRTRKHGFLGEPERKNKLDREIIILKCIEI